MLSNESITMILESLSTEKVECYTLLRKQLIELEVKKSITQEEYNALELYVQDKIKKLETARDEVLAFIK